MSPVLRKPDFCICENKDADQPAVTAKLISAFVFATMLVQFFYFLNTKFQASSHLLWLQSPVCVRPGQKPRRPGFSQRGSYHLLLDYSKQEKSHVMRKPTFWFPTWSDTNWAVQLQKMARGLKLRIWKVEELYYLCSENKGADQLLGYREADLRLCFRICKILVFS